MTDVGDMRLKIDEIDRQIFKLLIARQKVAQEIWNYKKYNQISYEDSNREILLINQFNQATELLNDSELTIYYQNIIQSILKETKEYLHKVIVSTI